jgi:hypothetical protein
VSARVSSTPGPSDSATSADFAARCDTIEGAYEFFLAYASQGLPSDQGSERGREVRDYLRRCDAALSGIGELIIDVAGRAGLDPAPYRAFVDVLERDARDASAAIRLVLAQPAIGSQLIDNLNASIHLRALLTDLFLIDEVLKLHRDDRR